jgi:hypothetical protein
VQRVLGRGIQYHVAWRGIEDGDGDFLGGDLLLIHALVQELLPATAVVIDGAIALIAAWGAAILLDARVC